ncbi:hypothetical protein [Ammoniphilus sp. 3BR4]|uniref:hypothetical protein n=1 Tax=Ammoniphilus sp. 3BR4 TaxID=3158265 RepID=UPI0034665352
MKKFRALSCLVFALCLVFYAVPRLPIQGQSELATNFSFVWLAFAMLVVGSNLFYVLGPERQRSAQSPGRLAEHQPFAKRASTRHKKRSTNVR